MVSFDRELWEKRARKRHGKGVGSSPPTGAIANEMRAIVDLESLIGWCGERGVSVTFTNMPPNVGATYDSEQNFVQMSGRFLPEKQLIVLLHECGHMLIGNRRKHERYGMGHQSDPTVTRTLHHRFDVLDEEMEAWYRGRKLAKRLKLKIDQEAFHTTRLACLKSYAKWVLEPNNFEKDDA